jgi:hypothetical protein
MELCCRYDFCKLLHVCRFDVDDVEALVLYVEVPKIDPKVVTTDEGLAVTVYRNAVDVVSVRIGVRLLRHCCNNGIVMCHPGEFQVRRGAKMYIGIPHRSSTFWYTAWCQLMG